MTQIAFDTATHTGYAYRVVGGWKHGVFDPRNTARLGEIIHEAIRAGCDVAVLEENYLDRKTMNVRTVQVLQDCQSRIASECERRGLPFRPVAAVSWQAGWGIKGVRKERKAHAMLIARGLCPGDKLTQDEADAICMAEWWRLSKRDLIPLQAKATSKKTTARRK